MSRKAMRTACNKIKKSLPRPHKRRVWNQTRDITLDESCYGALFYISN